MYSESFDAGTAGYAGGGTNTSWAWGTPTTGPGGAHSGAGVWATNLAGNYNNGEDSAVTSPAIDMGAYAGQWPVVSWWQWLQTANENYAIGYAERRGECRWSDVGLVDGPV